MRHDPETAGAYGMIEKQSATIGKSRMEKFRDGEVSIVRQRPDMQG